MTKNSAEQNIPNNNSNKTTYRRKLRKSPEREELISHFDRQPHCTF